MSRESLENQGISAFLSEEFAWVSAHEFCHVLGLKDTGDWATGTITGAVKQKVSNDDLEAVLKLCAKS